MMITLWTAIGGVEICIMLLIVAAAVLATAIKPASTGHVMTYLYACDIIQSPPFAEINDDPTPSLRLRVLDDMSVEVGRSGFGGLLTDRGAVSLAVTVKGTDITIEERITPGSGYYLAEPVVAVGRIDCLRPAGRPLHVRYITASLSRETALPLSIAPGVEMSRKLSQ